jgi:hypothetical protein
VITVSDKFTASERYSEKEKGCQEIMRKYFVNQYDDGLKKEKGNFFLSSTHK